MNNNLIEKAKEHINLLEYIENATHTRAKKNGKSYFINPCPICSHKDHFSIDAERNLFNSFSGCCEGGSIVDFIMQFENLSKVDAIEKVIEISGLNDNEVLTNKNYKKISDKGGQLITMDKSKNKDFNKLIEKLHSNVGQTNYYHNRGLTDKTINKYKLGYSKEGFNFAINNCQELQEKQSNIMASYKYFLPIWDNDDKCGYFIARLDDASIKEGINKLNKTHNLKGYTAKIFNERYLKDLNLKDNIIFIVEGIFDALSLEELDYKSIALNSTANANILLDGLKKGINSVKNKIFVLIPDNDKAGMELKIKLIKGFKELGLMLQICEIESLYKDCNEFLEKDRIGFTNYISDFIQVTTSNNFNINYLDKFLVEIEKSKDTKVISTGFKGLNGVFGGGLYPGLYTLGAISSLGKTTVILQIADDIALNGYDVLYFSLEMSKNEIVRKSISREMFLIEPNKAVTSRDISRGNFDKELFDRALVRYKEIGRNIAVIEGGFELGVQEIREMIKKNIMMRGKKPVVVVDYFQILRPFKNGMSDKQANDYNISELKKISRDFDIPVIAISSFNRMNYTSAVGFESFKETGAIEYSSDAVIGLQLKGIEAISDFKTETEKRNRINELKMKYPREIELVTIKQRDGVAFAKQNFRYFSKYNCFMEA